MRRLILLGSIAFGLAACAPAAPPEKPEYAAPDFTARTATTIVRASYLAAVNRINQAERDGQARTRAQLAAEGYPNAQIDTSRSVFDPTLPYRNRAAVMVNRVDACVWEAVNLSSKEAETFGFTGTHAWRCPMAVRMPLLDPDTCMLHMREWTSQAWFFVSNAEWRYAPENAKVDFAESLPGYCRKNLAAQRKLARNGH